LGGSRWQRAKLTHSLQYVESKVKRTLDREAEGTTTGADHALRWGLDDHVQPPTRIVAPPTKAADSSIRTEPKRSAISSKLFKIDMAGSFHPLSGKARCPADEPTMTAIRQ
jgi:hypothetical protein